MMLPDTSRLEFDPKAHCYKLDGKLLSGVTSVIDGTSSKQNLIQWAADMAVDYVKDNATGVIGADDWYVKDHVLEEARKAHTRKKENAATKGTDTHALVEEYVKKCIATTGGVPALLPDNEVIQPFVDWAQRRVMQFICSEQRVFSEKKATAGTLDIAYIDKDGLFTLGDVKSFPKLWSVDPYHQLGGYAGMWRELTGDCPQRTSVIKICDPQDPRLKKYGTKAFMVYERNAVEEDIAAFDMRLSLYRSMQNFVSPNE